jgi:hypothetical protein
MKPVSRGAAGLEMSTTWTPLYLQVCPPQAARKAVLPSGETLMSAIFPASTFFSASLLMMSTFRRLAGRCPSSPPC